MATRIQIAALLKKMNYCPVCGDVLTWFGTPGGEYKNCRTGCGVMKVHGKKSQLPSMLFEPAVAE